MPWCFSTYDNLIQIPLKFVPKGKIEKMPALVKVMAWHWVGGKPLPEPLMTTIHDPSGITRQQYVNPLGPGRFEWHFREVIFMLILVIDGWVISFDIAYRWMSLDCTDDQSTLVQVMAWCRQATSHNLSQCLPSSTSLYRVTRPQWVNHAIYTSCISPLSYLMK